MKRHKRWMIPLLALVTLAIVVSVTVGVGIGAPVGPETVRGTDFRRGARGPGGSTGRGQA